MRAARSATSSALPSSASADKLLRVRTAAARARRSTIAASRMEGISVEELQLAARNHAMPLEALR